MAWGLHIGGFDSTGMEKLSGDVFIDADNVHYCVVKDPADNQNDISMTVEPIEEQPSVNQLALINTYIDDNPYVEDDNDWLKELIKFVKKNA
jgi:hypothetical protein